MSRRNERARERPRRGEDRRHRGAAVDFVIGAADMPPPSEASLGRWMGLDVGEKTVGVATTDELGLTASPRETLRRDGREVQRLADWVAREGVRAVVVGLPLSLNGTMGPAARLVLEFVEVIRAKLPVPVETWDERLTTAEAEKILVASETRRAQRRRVVDQLAATLILQAYLRHRSLQQELTLPQFPAAE